MRTYWHTLEEKTILEELRTSRQGLSANEVEVRLKRYGKNALPESKPESILLIFLRQFQSPLIYILLIAGLIVLAMGEELDAIVIMVVLVFNALLGAFQEGKARDTLLALKQFVETKALLVRAGKELIVPDKLVVPGDILILQEGEKIPADARIIESKNLKIDESALTGESVAVHKQVLPLPEQNLPDSEKRNMVFKGTNIVAGTGLAVVTATGVETVIGRIAKEVSEIDTEIPLKTNVRNLSRVIIISTIIICVLIFGLGLSYGIALREMFATAVSVAVSVIPSGLPIALTIILASGVLRMSRRNALVKKLQAVEALGQARIIAVDKTGTITKNEMMIESVYVGGELFKIGGVGYEPQGGVTLAGESVVATNHDKLMHLAKLSAFCASARTIWNEERKEWRVSGDPTEAAMFVFAEKLGVKKDELEQELNLLSEIPFDYNLKYHATLHKDKRANLLTVVGAPEAILKLSKDISNSKRERLTLKRQAEIEAKVLELSRQGLRVLAVAEKKLKKNDFEKSDVSELTLVGLFGLKDALRPEVREATRLAQEAGLKVVMITGDHKETGTALAKEAGIYKQGDLALTGEEIELLSESALKEQLQKVSVFARVTPEHKLRIIKAYRARGEIVAMTGDGVNDAPSLVAADLGVAMGKAGTEVAKEASDIILLDDNFASIVSAIEEGRNIYKTIKKVNLYLLSTSIGEVLVIGGALLLGLPLPLLAAQIIWLNFVTDGFFIPALAMEPREENLLKSKFEKPNKYLVDGGMVLRMLLMSLSMMVATLLLFANVYEDNLAKAWTLSLTVLAIFQWFNAWNCRSETESVFKQNPLGNKWLIAGTLTAFGFQLLAVYHPLFQKFLRTVPLELSDWLLSGALALSIVLVDEVRKYLARMPKVAQVLKFRN